MLLFSVLNLYVLCSSMIFSSISFVWFGAKLSWLTSSEPHSSDVNRETDRSHETDRQESEQGLVGYSRVQYQDRSLQALIGRCRSRVQCESQTNMGGDQKLYPVWAGDTGSTCRQTGIRHHLCQVQTGEYMTELDLLDFTWLTWWCPQRAGQGQEGKTWH